MYIYEYVNKINGKRYIGQTNDIENRKRGHKSAAYNKKDHCYNLPFYKAIRKYGLENFDFYILEADLTNEQANEREQFWIKNKKTLISENGYNIALGGGGYKRDKLNWEERIKLSKKFSEEEIFDIQKRLIKGEDYQDILDFYSPRLKKTFLSNINNGYNFKNLEFDYPLKKKSAFNNGKFTKEQIREIKKDIKKGIIYKEIKLKWGIKSEGFLSMVNSGKYYYDPNETYPLIVKGCSDKSWIFPCIKDILFTNLSLVKISEKHNKAYSTIKKINSGLINKKEFFKYPLRKNKEPNQEKFRKCCIDYL